MLIGLDFRVVGSGGLSPFEDEIFITEEPEASIQAKGQVVVAAEIGSAGNHSPDVGVLIENLAT